MRRNLFKVFVYGTLKRGEPNHHWFEKEKTGYYKFICNARTIEKYPLIIGTEYNIPFLLHSPGKGHFVRGEVYEVDEKVLKDLDELENHPNFYIREEKELKNLDENGIVKAWIYFIKSFKKELLESEMYENYSSTGPHNLKYVASEEATLDDLNDI